MKANLLTSIRRLAHRVASAEWARDVAVVALIFFLALFLFHTDLMEGRIYYEPDTGTYYYPVMSAVDRAIDRIAVPLWTRHIFGGYPLFADGEGGALYPPNVLLLWLLPIQQAFLMLRVVRFFLAGVFLYAYCRVLGIGRCGALLGAVTFAFGSFMVGQLQHTNVSNGAVWLPLVLLFVEKGLRSPARKGNFYFLVAGVALAMQSLALHIQPLILTLLALSLYIAFRTVIWRGLDAWGAGERQPRLRGLPGVVRSACKAIPRAVLAMAIVLIVGLGLAAIQLVPLWELGQASSRGAGPSYWFATLYGLPVVNLVTLIFPYFFVGPGGYVWSLWALHESTLYAGIAPLALAMLAVLFVRRRMAIFFVFLAALSLYLSFGDYPPVKLYWLLWQVPGINFLRAPARFSYLFTFSLAILAAMGLNWLIHGHWSRANQVAKNRATKVLAFSAGIVALTAGIVSGELYMRDALQSNAGAAVEFIQKQYLTMRNWNTGISAEGVYEALLYSLDISNPHNVRAFFFLGASAVALLLWLRFRKLARLWAVLLLCVGVVDLMTFAVDFHPRASYSGLSTPSGATKFLVDNNGIHRVYNKSYVRATEPNRLLAWGVSIVGGYSSLNPLRNVELNKLIERGNLGLLNLWNVRYIVADAGEPMPGEYRVVYRQDDAVIYENPRVMPRAFLVGAAVIAPDAKAALAKVAENTFDPSRVVVLEEAFDLSLLPAGNGSMTGHSQASAGSPGESRIVEYSGESALIKTSSLRSSFLILSDSYYPGWTAYVDGQEAKVYRANYLFRGVFVPAGEHEVVYRYEPASFYAGQAISVATLLVVIAGLLSTAPRWPVPLWASGIAVRRRASAARASSVVSVEADAPVS